MPSVFSFSLYVVKCQQYVLSTRVPHTQVFFYALAFEPTGPVVHMVFQISYAVRSWAVLLFMNIVAFGTALLVLFQYTDTDDQFL